MPADTKQTFVVLDDEEITFGELTRTCRVHAEWVVELVDEGVIEPRGPRDGAKAQHWRFSATTVVRVQKAHRLQRDLGVNLPRRRPGASAARSHRCARSAPALRFHPTRPARRRLTFVFGESASVCRDAGWLGRPSNRLSSSGLSRGPNSHLVLTLGNARHAGSSAQGRG
ncbi:MAG: chaperone modulator CbpM [Hyphomicrobium sp.]